MSTREVAAGLVRSCHPLPTLAVTLLTALLVLGAGGGWAGGGLVVAAVLTGQLVIGWSNDLVDADRDAAVGRPDKPLASGALARGPVRTALLLAAVATVGLSLLAPWPTAVLHLGLVVGSGLA